LLLIVFLLSLFIEVMNPGLILPGTVAGFALLLLVAPPMLVSLNYIWAVVAILAGISLIALEIFVLPGFGVFGVLGLVLLFGGLVGVVIPTGGQGLFPGDASNSRLGTGLATFAIALSTAGVGMYLIGRHLGSLPILNRLILSGVARNDDDREQAMSGQVGMGAAGGIGTLDSDLIDARGVVISPLRPSGRVQVGERIIDAVADTGYIPAGAAVRIIEASSFRVVVERVDDPGPGAGGAQA
jgi:membrane-bound serine protease (ClpP class)